MKTRIETNIFKIYLFQALRWFLIFMPVQVLFFQENGLSMKEVMFLQTVFSISIIIFELPSGYFSDTLGRKKTLVIGSILSFLGFGIFSISYNFFSLLIGEIVLGIAASFVSGTDSAILYDTLKQLNRQSEYKRAEGKLMAICNFSEATASILGGFVALISLRTNIYLETFLVFLTIPVTISLIEPEKENTNKKENIFSILRYTMIGNPTVRNLVLYSGVISASTLTMIWFVQPYLKLMGIPLYLFGVIWALLNFSVGLFSLSASYIEQKTGMRKALIINALLPVFGFLFLSITSGYLSFLFILIFYFVRGFSGPLLKDYLNTHLSSDMRATVLSISSLICRIIFSFTGPLIGYLNDLYSIKVAMFSAAIIFLLMGLGVLSLVLKEEKKLVINA